MTTLEELLRTACAKGLTHLTLYPVPSADGKTTYWHARATPSTGHSYVQVSGTDPMEAIIEVLKALPKAPKRARIDPHRGTNYEQLTAEVSDEPQPGDLDAWLPKA